MRRADTINPTHRLHGSIWNLALTGCPCGCSTRLPFSDDPDCIRHQPLPEAVTWTAYDIHDLGLEPHDRRLCTRCQAVAS